MSASKLLSGLVLGTALFGCGTVEEVAISETVRSQSAEMCDCSAITQVSEELRLQGGLLGMFECDESDYVQIRDGLTRQELLDQLSEGVLAEAANEVNGDCADVLEKVNYLLENMMDRVQCDKGQPKETFVFGEGRGGTYFSGIGFSA